ncbi:hypothetical protein ANRL1_01689 [Anaerolineae bacterium]|nr:hypothetical protein ANRL1_01689 [Anaerolineae bacterium]
MEVLNVEELDGASGGLNGYTGAGLILGLAGLAATPLVIGVALGAAGGLVIAQLLAKP